MIDARDILDQGNASDAEPSNGHPGTVHVLKDYQASDLRRIERYARHAINDAANIVGTVRLLRSQPSFETRAEDALKNAEADLELALNAIRKAMAEFNSKPATE